MYHANLYEIPTEHFTITSGAYRSVVVSVAHGSSVEMAVKEMSAVKAVSAALVVLLANKIMREACRREMAARRCWRHGGDGEGGVQERGESCSSPSTPSPLNSSTSHHLFTTFLVCLAGGGEAVGGCLIWGTDGGAGGAGGDGGAGDTRRGWTHR
jgi:hypothetical protein